jgi:hypothetical protein
MTLILSGSDGLSDVDGSAATPAIRGTDANTGIFFPAADTIAFSEGGVESMRIDSSGNVGIGTVSPRAKVDVSGSVLVGTYQTSTTYPALGIKTSSPVTTPSTFTNAINLWNGTTVGDYSNITFGYNTAGITNAAAYMGFVSTNQGSLGYGDLVFGTRNVTTDTAATERMRIDSSGNLLVGTTSVPSLNGNTAGKFVVVNGTAQVGLQDNTDGGIFATYNLSKSIGLSAGSSYGSGAGQAFIKLTPTTGSSASIVATANTGGVQLTNGATSWASLSDIRLKDVTGGIENALSAVAQLEPIKFTWKSDEGKKPCVGLSAQSVQSVLPEAVDEFVVPESADETAYLTVRYTELVPLLTAAIKEQQALITALQADVAALKGTP